MKKASLLLRLLALVLFANTLQAQIKLGDNPGTIDVNSLLELESTTKGLLFPRIDSTNMVNMASPPRGMVLFNTTKNCLYIRRTSDWFSLCNADPTTTTTGFQLPSLTNVQMTSVVSPVNGMLIYNTTNNAVYGYINGTWQSLVNSASNGLTKVEGDVKLGGTLTGNTTIATAGNTLTISGNGTTDALKLPDLKTGTGADSLVTLGAGGVLNKRSAGDVLNTTAWKIDGNSATSSAVNFLGTTDAQALVVKTENTERMRILPSTPAVNEVPGALAVGRTSAFATFHLGGSMATPIRTETAAYTVTNSDYTVIGNCSGGAFALNLPNPVTCPGRMYIIIKGDASNNVLSFSQPISLSSTQSMSSVNYNVRLHIQSDGANWWLIARF
jgi:hypothetical protein